MTYDLIASDRVEGTTVRRPSGEKIGVVQRLMIEKASGRVAYAVLTFGGFLRLGQKHISLPWAALRYNVLRDAYEVRYHGRRASPCASRRSRIRLGQSRSKNSGAKKSTAPLITGSAGALAFAIRIKFL